MFWTVFIITLLVVSLYVATRMYNGPSLTASQRKALGSSKLSPVSRQLLREYNDLPAESRPFADITSILVALDIKHSDQAVKREKHFNNNWYYYLDEPGITGGYKFSWRASGSGSCGHSYHCQFHDYYQLHQDIQAVKNSLAETQKQIKLANYDDTDLHLLTSRLREEVRIQHEVRKELS